MLKSEDIYTNLSKNYDSRFLCDLDTDIVIEGFPRSSNTFTVDFVTYLNKNKNLKIAHHTHNHFNVILGVLLKKPTLVLIRRPKDAIASYMIYSGLTVESAFKRYNDFYNGLLEFKEQFLCVDFDEIVSDMNTVITKINKRFSIDLEKSSNITSDSSLVSDIARTRARINRPESDYVQKVAAPTQARNIFKENAEVEVLHYLNNNPKADVLYEKYIG